VSALPCQHSINIAQTHAVDITDQHSRSITKRDIKLFDYIVAMDRQNKADMEKFGFTNVHIL
jgi:protein-tyrosine-phosphatase